MDFCEKLYDVLILGGGPAGLSAAVYAGRSGLSVLIIEGAAFGGAMYRTSKIANYPGIAQSETGAEMSARFESHAAAFGAEKAYGMATEASLHGEIKEVKAGNITYKGRTLIIATGSISAKLGIPGEEEYLGRGVSYCAVCDGPFFSGLDVYVAGDGFSAIEESLYLAGFARSVTILHKRGALRASNELRDKLAGNDKIITIPNTVVTELGGGELLTSIKTKNEETGELREICAAEGESIGLFIFAGMAKAPQTGIFGGELDMENGYIVTDEEMRTSIAGVFAAGDVRRKTLRQVVTAAADGAIAAVRAEKYLLEEK